MSSRAAYMREYRARPENQGRTRRLNRQSYDRMRADPEKKNRRAEKAKQWRGRNPAKVLLRGAKNRAERDGVELTLTEQDVARLLEPMTCAVTGVQLEWLADGSRSPIQPSLDRIEGPRGYVAGNVRVVSWIYNRAKGNGTDAEVLQMAQALIRASIK